MSSLAAGELRFQLHQTTLAGSAGSHLAAGAILSLAQRTLDVEAYLSDRLIVVKAGCDHGYSY